MKRQDKDDVKEKPGKKRVLRRTPYGNKTVCKLQPSNSLFLRNCSFFYLCILGKISRNGRQI